MVQQTDGLFPSFLLKGFIPAIKKWGCSRLKDKDGVEGFIKKVALETAASGIRANAIMTGPVETQLIKNQLSKIVQEKNLSIEEVKEKFIFNNK